MKRILFCVDSYFQLIGSVNLRLELYKNYYADLIIYNTTPTAEQVYNRLAKMEIFENVYVAKTKLTMVGDNISRIKKFPKYFEYVKSIVFPEKVCRNMLGVILDEKYDYIFFHGYGAIFECIFNVCYRNNHKIKCYRIDDGLGTYLDEWCAPKWKIRTIFEKVFYSLCSFKFFYEYIEGYYVSAPELMTFTPNYPVYTAPRINKNNEKLVSCLNKIFGYSKDDCINDAYVIFFGTWGDGVKSDIELLSLIKEMVPIERIIIKVHPREEVKKYSGLGIKIIERSDVPWEVIMMNVKSSDMIFVTLESSAVFTSRLYFDREKGKDFYCYKCSEIVEERLPETMKEWIKHLIKENGENVIIVPNNIEQFAIKMEECI